MSLKAARRVRALSAVILLIPMLGACSSLSGMKSCRGDSCTTTRPAPPQGI